MSEVEKKSNAGFIPGIVASFLAIFGIFSLGVVFVPIAALVAIVGTYLAIKNPNSMGIGFNLLAWLLTIAGLVTSPVLLVTLFGMFAASATHHQPDKVEAKAPLSANKRLALRVTTLSNLDLSLGPLTIAAISRCDKAGYPCEHTVDIKNSTSSLKLSEIGPSGRAFSREDLGWKADKFLTISYDGGMCWNCAGYDVVTLANDRLVHLGRFTEISDNHLIRSYEKLEYNSLMPHAASPSWKEYYRESDGVAILDIAHTCNSLQKDFIRKKKQLLIELQRNSNDAEKLAPLILGTLAETKYCGWKDENIQLQKTLNSSIDFSRTANMELAKATKETLKSVLPIGSK